MTTLKTICTNDNIGNITMQDGTPVILDSLLVQDCKIFFPKLPYVQFSLQSIAPPEIRVNEVKQLTRYVDPNEIGEKVIYEPFTVTFLVDKLLRNYSEIFNWMKRMTANGSIVGEVDEPILFIDNKPSLQFVGAWPTRLGGIQFNATVPQAEYVTCSLTLNYDYMNLVNSYSTIDSVYK